MPAAAPPVAHPAEAVAPSPPDPARVALEQPLRGHPPPAPRLARPVLITGTGYSARTMTWAISGAPPGGPPPRRSTPARTRRTSRPTTGATSAAVMPLSSRVLTAVA